MMLFIALLAIAPLSAVIIGGSKVRLGLIVTTLVTGACATVLQLWFELVDPGDIVTMLLFAFVALPAICGIVAGVVATRLAGAGRAFGLPIISGVVGAIAGQVLGAVARPFPFADLEDLLLTIWWVMPPVVVGSSLAVLAAALNSRRT